MAPPTGELPVDDDVSGHRPSNAIGKPRFDVAVSSVHYQRERGIPTCIVVLDVSFVLEQGVRLVDAVLPLDLKPYKDSSASAPQPDFYIYSHFTGTIEEVIVMELDTVQETTSSKLTALKIPKRQHSLGGKKKESTKLYDNTMSLVGTRLKNNMHVQWTFRNETKEHYPRNVKLMISVKKTENIRQLFFSFTLELGSDFHLSVFGEGLVQKFKMMLSAPSGPQLIHIAGSWQPEIAKDMLIDVAKFYDTDETPAPQHIGLRAAFRTLSSVSPLHQQTGQ